LQEDNISACAANQKKTTTQHIRQKLAPSDTSKLHCVSKNGIARNYMDRF